MDADGRSWSRSRIARGNWCVAGVLSILLLSLALRPASASANQLVTVTIPAQQGEIPGNWLPYAGPPRATVELPDGYDPQRAYPLLLNLGGLTTDYASAADTDWPDVHINAIIATPEGYDGWYADWWNDGERGGPAWESYELNEVLPYILRHYRILPQRRYHAIVGISMGGLGATYLGGRLPGFFGSVATLSGFVDPQFGGDLTGEALGLFAPHGDNRHIESVYGPASGFYATGHNPTALVQNLEYTRVFQTSGTGVPSSAGLTAGLGPALGGSVAEGLIIHPMNQAYNEALTAAGVDVTYQTQPGGHDIPDFTNEIQALLAWGLFKPVISDPQTWTNLTVATSGRLWDVGYRFAQPPDAVVQLRQTGRTLTIGAAGSAVTITTGSGCTVRAATPATITLPRGRCGAYRPVAR